MPEALDNINAIIESAAAVMFARGGLGVETSPEEVPVAQKRSFEKLNQAKIPVITATQMLEGMIRNPRPTRAEASDVANAILGGTDATMLSAKTSIGEYPVEAVRTMNRIVHEVEGHQNEIPARPLGFKADDITFAIGDAVGRAARETANSLDPATLICPTASGHTARIMSHYHPQPPVITITPREQVQGSLMLYGGVTPLLAPRTDNMDRMIGYVLDSARKRDLLREGDIVVIIAGAACSKPGTTNLMRVHMIEKQVPVTEQDETRSVPWITFDRKEPPQSSFAVLQMMSKCCAQMGTKDRDPAS